MDIFTSINWEQMLIPNHALEMVIRGILTYFGLLVILKLVLKKQIGSLTSSDLLVTVLIADAIQNGMAGEYKSVPDGLILVTTIVVMDYCVDWLSYRYRFIAKLINPPPIPLVRNGHMLRRQMRRELITEAELWAKLRQEGVDHLTEVKGAFLENEGDISVIKRPRK